MLRLSFIAIFILTSLTCYSRTIDSIINPNLNYHKSVKLYLGIERRPDFIQTNDNFFQLAFNPTFQWRNKRANFHEIGLNNLTITRASVLISLRYEFILNFMKHQQGNWVPGLGFGAIPYFQEQKYVPVITNDYPNTHLNAGSIFFLSPRLTYYFSKRFYTDFTASLNLFRIGWAYQNIKNPNLEPNAQKYAILDIDALYGSALRFSIGWKF